jgi:DNA topoisomerase IB
LKTSLNHICGCAMHKRAPKPSKEAKPLLDAIGKNAPDLAKVIADWLKVEAKRVADHVVARMFPTQKSDLRRALRKVIPADVSAIMNSADIGDMRLLAGIITDKTEPVFRKAYEKGNTVLFHAISTNLVDERAVAYAEARAAEMVGMKIVAGIVVVNPDASWSITNTTRNDIRTIVAQSIQTGATPDAVSKAILESTTFSDTRAMNIARTELSNAFNQGNLAGWKDSGVNVFKKSVLGNLHDVDDECDAAAADEPIPLDALFSNGQSAPPYHPNCVCALVPVVQKGDATKVDLSVLTKGAQAGHPFEGNQWIKIGSTGKTATYDTKGKKLSAADHARYKAAKVPAVYTHHVLSKDPKAALQAKGMSGSGKAQSFYSKEHIAARAAKKVNQMHDLAPVREKSMNQALKDMKSKVLTSTQRDAAAVTHIIASTGIRVGGESATAYGATTLLAKHATFSKDGKAMYLNFIGKHGMKNYGEVTNKDVIAYIKGNMAGLKPSASIFNVSSKSVNNYIKASAGAGFSAKNYRTWIGTATAQAKIATMKVPKTAAELKSSMKIVAETVAKKLSNTPAIAQSSYILPEVYNKWPTY